MCRGEWGKVKRKISSVSQGVNNVTMVIFRYSVILGVNMLKKVNVQCSIWGICTVHYNYLDAVLYHYWR